jgi:hypothetical protein
LLLGNREHLLCIIIIIMRNFDHQHQLGEEWNLKILERSYEFLKALWIDRVKTDSGKFNEENEHRSN